MEKRRTERVNKSEHEHTEHHSLEGNHRDGALHRYILLSRATDPCPAFSEELCFAGEPVDTVNLSADWLIVAGTHKRTECHSFVTVATPTP